MREDIRYALRTFARNPGLVAAVLISIGLGVAANATVFSVVNALMFGDLPVRQPERLMSFSGGRSMSWLNYNDFRDGTKNVFEGVSAHFVLVPASVGGRGEPERVWGQMTSANYFNVMGLQPALGRGFLAEEDRMGGARAVVVLGHGLWQRRFGGDQAIVGKSIRLNGRAFEVIGVMPPGWRGSERGFIAEFWAPLGLYKELMPDLANGPGGGLDLLANRDAQWLIVHGRLRDGVSREQAQAALQVVEQRILKAQGRKPDPNRRPVSLEKAGGLIDGMGKAAVGLSGVLMAVVGLVLLIACANVANLLLARAAARQKEIAVRVALGASRGRIVRQLLTESTLLSIAGAVLGFALAWFAAASLSKFQPPLPVPIRFDYSPDARVLLFTAAIAVLSGLLFGIAPALRATRSDLVSMMKQDGGSLGRFRRFGLRNGLVVAQVSMSIVLLVGAVLFLRSLGNANSIELGMRADNVLLMAVDPKIHNYTPQRSREFLAALRNQAGALPGVRAVTYLDSIPLSIGGTNFDVKAGDRTQNTDVYMVGARYFETFGTRVVRGRDFVQGRDTEASAVINETLAKRLFPKEDALGRQFTSEKKTYEIVGISEDIKSRTLGEDPASVVYFYVEDNPERVMSFYGISVAVRTFGPPRAMERAIREQIRTLDPNLAVFNVETMQEHVDAALLLPTVCATLLGIFGAVGLALAVVGLYAVVNYSVRARVREIGIRMALGAERSKVVGLVALQGMALVGAGLVIGTAGAFVLSRFTESLLYGISTRDAVTFISVPAIMILAGLAAVFGPARRAARVDPMSALRYE